MSSDQAPLRDPDDDTDVRLLSAAAAGDQPAWLKLYERYGKVAFDWCRRSGLPLEDSEDVAQEVFWTVHRGLERFDRRTDGSFRGWLYRICERRIADHQRTFARRRLRAVAVDLERLPSRGGPADSADGRLAVALLRVRGQVSERTWALFDAYVLQDRPAVEVAYERGISRYRVYHARARVIRLLREELGDSCLMA